MKNVMAINAPVASREEAHEIVSRQRTSSGSNWITGEHALGVLALAMKTRNQMEASPQGAGGLWHESP